MATIGQTLSAARVAAGYTIADLSARTRIRESVLTGIEEEDFVPCGGDFYARGHIRGISRALGLDPAPLLAEYDHEHASAGDPAFVPLQRHPVARPAAARAAAAAARNGTHTGDDEESTTVLRLGGGGGPTTAPERREHPEHREHSERGGHPERGGYPEHREHSEHGPGTGRGWDGGCPEEPVALPAPRCGAEEGRGDRALRGDHGAGIDGDVTGRGPRDRGPAPRAAVTGKHSTRAEAFRRHWPWAVVGIIIVLGIVVGIRTWQNWDGDNPVRTAFRSSGGEESVDSAVLPEEGAGGAVAGEKAVAEELTEITVGLEASIRTWIQVIDAEGEGLFTGFLLEDEKQEYVSEGTLTLWVANAGAVSVSVNGEDLGPLGFGGEVKEVTIGPDGFGE